MIIPLRDVLLRRFSNLPAGSGSGFELSFLPVSPPGRIGPIRFLPPGEERQDPCLFGLAPCGVYPATPITGRAVRSYRTFSPLPRELADLPKQINNLRRYVLCCTCRPAALKRPSRTLSGTLPCGVRTFLPRSTPLGARAAAIIQPPAGISVSHRISRNEQNCVQMRMREEGKSRFEGAGLVVSTVLP
jgi:hypothetical protein